MSGGSGIAFVDGDGVWGSVVGGGDGRWLGGQVKGRIGCG